MFPRAQRQSTAGAVAHEQHVFGVSRDQRGQRGLRNEWTKNPPLLFLPEACMGDFMFQEEVEPLVRLELTTYALQVRCSTN